MRTASATVGISPFFVASNTSGARVASAAICSVDCLPALNAAAACVRRSRRHANASHQTGGECSSALPGAVPACVSLPDLCLHSKAASSTVGPRRTPRAVRRQVPPMQIRARSRTRSASRSSRARASSARPSRADTPRHDFDHRGSCCRTATIGSSLPVLRDVGGELVELGVVEHRKERGGLVDGDVHESAPRSRSRSSRT